MNKYFWQIAVVCCVLAVVIPIGIGKKEVKAQIYNSCIIDVGGLSIEERSSGNPGEYVIRNYFTVDCLDAGGRARGRCNWSSIIDLWYLDEQGNWEPYNSWCQENGLACGGSGDYKEPYVIIELPPGNYYILSGVYKGDCSNVGPAIDQTDIYFSTP